MRLTKEIKEIRKTGIGGSDVAAIAGISPYENATPLQIYLQKIGELENNLSNDAIEWGHIHESNVAYMYAKKTGKELEDEPLTFRHPVYTFMIANPDRLIKNEKALLECKTAGFRQKDKWGKEGTSQIPDAYYLQVAHYAIVCDVEYVDIAVLIDVNDHRIYRYHRHEKIENKIIEIEKNFWENHVIPRIPPAAINKTDSSLRWPLANPESSKEIDASHKDIVNNLNLLQQQVEILTKKQTELKNKICNYMQDAETLIDSQNNYIATWKNHERTSLDIAQLKAQEPLLYQKYSITKSVRSLRINSLNDSD